MKFHRKIEFPKETYLDMKEDAGFASYIRGKLLTDLAKTIEPYATYEENEIVCDPVEGPWKYTQECTCTLDVCLPTKLLPIDGTGRFYQCQQCLRNISKFTGEHVYRYGVDIIREFDLNDSIGKYCPDCGSWFTNLHRNESGYLYVKEED